MRLRMCPLLRRKMLPRGGRSRKGSGLRLVDKFRAVRILPPSKSAICNRSARGTDSLAAAMTRPVGVIKGHPDHVGQGQLFDAFLRARDTAVRAIVAIVAEHE